MRNVNIYNKTGKALYLKLSCPLNCHLLINKWNSKTDKINVKNLTLIFIKWQKLFEPTKNIQNIKVQRTLAGRSFWGRPGPTQGCQADDDDDDDEEEGTKNTLNNYLQLHLSSLVVLQCLIKSQGLANNRTDLQINSIQGPDIQL
jgi:hypothetical protein